MRETLDLGGIDLNLLPKFRALYRRRSVSEAARDLHLTQSAVSNALARLRSLFGDELFVRTPNGMEPTPLGYALAEPIDRALAKLESEFRQIHGFNPERSARTFKIGMTQLAEVWIAPRLLATAQTAAPEIVLIATSAADNDVAHGLRAGNYDFAVGHFPELGDGYRDIELGVHDFLLMAREDHPVFAQPLTPEALVDCTFAEAVEPGAMYSEAGRELIRMARTRALRFRTTNMLALPWVVAMTDLVAFVPGWFGARYAEVVGVRMAPVPGISTSAKIRVFWHENFERDPGHAWMRSLIVRAAERARQEHEDEAQERARAGGADSRQLAAS